MAYNLDNYVTVAERLTQAGELIVTVVTEPPVLMTDVMGFIRATVALKDGRSATGTASFRLDLQGNRAQATNPIEDCETSAVGRALALLGYGSTKGIASREEIQEAQRRQEAPAQSQQTNGDASYDKPPICPDHNKEMRAGKNGGWYCPTKVGDGWCKARPAKPARTLPDDWSGEYNAIEESLL